MKNKQNILSKIQPITEKKSDIVKEAARKALNRLYPQVKISEEKLDSIVARMRKNAMHLPSMGEMGAMKDILIKKIKARLRLSGRGIDAMGSGVGDILGIAGNKINSGIGATLKGVGTRGEKLMKALSDTEATGKGFAEVFNPYGEKLDKSFQSWKKVLKEPGTKPRTVPVSRQGVETGLPVDMSSIAAKDKVIGGMDEYYKNLYKSVSGK